MLQPALVPHWAVAIENAKGKSSVVITCDHASNRIPVQFSSLGVSEADLERHIAWDPGALGVSRSLSKHLDAPLVASTVSRLLIDCNRDPGVFDAIPESSEDTSIPGNASLKLEDRSWRIREVYEPFHNAVAAMLGNRPNQAQRALIAIHSYTPVYRGVSRPWHIGILFDHDRSLSDPILGALQQDKGLCVGENQPYSPQDRVYHTLDRHGQSRGIPSVMIEIRNDLIATSENQDAWGRRLANVVKPALAGLFQTESGQPTQENPKG